MFHYCSVFWVSQYDKHQTFDKIFIAHHMLNFPDARVQSGIFWIMNHALMFLVQIIIEFFPHLLQRIRTNKKNKTNYNKTMINALLIYNLLFHITKLVPLVAFTQDTDGPSKIFWCYGQLLSKTNITIFYINILLYYLFQGTCKAST